MKQLSSLGLGLGLCLFAAEAQSVLIAPEQWVAPYKHVTNIFTVTNGTTAIVRKQIDAYFRTTNRHDGVVFVVQNRDNTNEWHIEGVSPRPMTNYVIGSQSGEIHRLILVSKPGQIQSVRRPPIDP